MSRPTNQDVAEMLGISNSMASRLRSGDRRPSVALMRKIEAVYRWKMAAQAKAFGTPAYAEGLEQAIDHLQPENR
jgi:transcriptional regulator with XRE-family HTH domain